jgi:hypothetical protein
MPQSFSLQSMSSFLAAEVVFEAASWVWFVVLVDPADLAAGFDAAVFLAAEVVFEAVVLGFVDPADLAAGFDAAVFFVAVDVCFLRFAGCFYGAAFGLPVVFSAAGSFSTTAGSPAVFALPLKAIESLSGAYIVDDDHFLRDSVSWTVI